MLLNYEQRNSDFLRAVRRAARRSMEQGITLNSRTLVREALASPAPAWYLSTEYVWRRLKLLEAGKLPPGSNRLRHAMLLEIAGLLRKAVAQKPDADPYALLDDLLAGNGPRPSRFFISEEYALRLFTGSARRRQPQRQALPRPQALRRCRKPHSTPPSISATTLTP